MSERSKIKVELRQQNISHGEEDIKLSIRSPEAILPDGASNYDVSLLKFSTSFNAPILHIPEDNPVRFWFYNAGDFSGVVEMKGIFKNIKEFCEEFTNQSPWIQNPNGWSNKHYKLEYDETTSLLSLVVERDDPNGPLARIHVDDRSAPFFKNAFYFKPLPDDSAEHGIYGTHEVSLDGLSILDGGERGTGRIVAVSNDNAAYYNFDYIQLITDLPISQTLMSTSISGTPRLAKMSTLGTVHANASTQDSYYIGGLIYLPNFIVTSSLTSDTPLYGFNIEPYLFYQTGHYEKLKLVGVDDGGYNSCYALIEFSPKE